MSTRVFSSSNYIFFLPTQPSTVSSIIDFFPTSEKTFRFFFEISERQNGFFLSLLLLLKSGITHSPRRPWGCASMPLPPLRSAPHTHPLPLPAMTQTKYPPILPDDPVVDRTGPIVYERLEKRHTRRCPRLILTLTVTLTFTPTLTFAYHPHAPPPFSPPLNPKPRPLGAPQGQWCGHETAAAATAMPWPVHRQTPFRDFKSTFGFRGNSFVSAP